MADQSRQHGVLVTGLPDPLMERVVAALAREGEGIFYALVEEREVFVVQRRLQALEREVSELAGRWHVMVAELSAERCGLGEALWNRLRGDVVSIWHASGTLSDEVSQGEAYARNVLATEQVLKLASSCGGLERLCYVSTVAVSGVRTGRVYEDELDEGQAFSSDHQATRCWAEARVQGALVPWTVFRLATVQGTGYVRGEHAALIALLQADEVVLEGGAMPLVSEAFVVEAMVKLARREACVGGVFHLTEARPEPRSGRRRARWWRRQRAVVLPDVQYDVRSTARVLRETLSPPVVRLEQEGQTDHG